MIEQDNPKGAKKAIEETIKSNFAVKQIAQSLKKTQDIMASGKNINTVDKAIRDNLSQYFGMSDEQMNIAFRDKRYASASNIIRNSFSNSLKLINRILDSCLIKEASWVSSRKVWNL